MIHEELFMHLMNNDPEFRDAVVSEASLLAASIFSAANEFGSEPTQTSAGTLLLGTANPKRKTKGKRKDCSGIAPKILLILKHRKNGISPVKIFELLNKKDSRITQKDVYNISSALIKKGNIKSNKQGTSNRTTYSLS